MPGRKHTKWSICIYREDKTGKAAESTQRALNLAWKTKKEDAHGVFSVDMLGASHTQPTPEPELALRFHQGTIVS